MMSKSSILYHGETAVVLDDCACVPPFDSRDAKPVSSSIRRQALNGYRSRSELIHARARKAGGTMGGDALPVSCHW